MTQPLVSIIIPVFNEATTIVQTLWRLKDDVGVELIVVDGGSQDDTVELVLQMGVKVISSPIPERAQQMNIGAAAARGDILLFLHADTQLPQNYQKIVQMTLAKERVIAGAFELAIDSQQWSLRLVEKMVNWRSRLCSLPYGDQAIFLDKRVFQDLGGFANLPIMEDFEFIQRLKRRGKIALAPVAVLTSDRRWQKLGVLKTTLINQLIIVGYYLGISPTRLRHFYHNRRLFSKNSK
ncbi:TIGR04283 family arsenosugar biosynthesis glycosyltransferase [Pleurocapsales cyanobacterium LEGE 06147]|nr:TIGR04283 family arsenosugar biosynthesis glycosyltransferase [Pleurocapsales cyanobacterium LEGE 06147]